MLYASYHPERIEGMFLQSPACAEDETRPGWEYDPYDIRLSPDEDVYPKASEVDKGILNYANNVHVQDGMHGMPFFMMKMGCESNMKTMCPAREGFTDEMNKAAALFYALMVQRWGKQEIV